MSRVEASRCCCPPEGRCPRLIFWVVVVEEGEEGRRRRCGGRGREGVELSWARGVCGAGDGQGTNNVPAPPGGGAPVNCTFPLPGPGRGGWVRGRAVSDPTLPKAREGCWRRRGAGAGAGAGAGLGWAGLGCSRCGGLPRRAGGGHFFPAGYDSARGPVVRGCAQRDLTTHGHQPSAPTGNWGRDEAEVRTEFSCSLRACTRGKKKDGTCADAEAHPTPPLAGNTRCSGRLCASDRSSPAVHAQRARELRFSSRVTTAPGHWAAERQGEMSGSGHSYGCCCPFATRQPVGGRDEGGGIEQTTCAC